MVCLCGVLSVGRCLLGGWVSWCALNAVTGKIIKRREVVFEVSRYRLYGSRDRILLSMWEEPLGLKEAVKSIQKSGEEKAKQITKWRRGYCGAWRYTIDASS